MAIWISNPDNDPVLKRGERLGRFGSCFPLLAMAVLNIVAATYHTAMNRSFDWGVVQVIILGFVALGQVIVWTAMEYLRRSQGWASGIVFFLWVGALFTTLTLLYIGIFPPMVIPWVAPIVATVAKARLARRKRVEEGTVA